MIPELNLEKMDWKKVDPAFLDDLLTDSVIEGAEPIDYPNTSGIIFYMRNRSGANVALIVEEEEESGGLIASLSWARTGSGNGLTGNK